MRYRPLAVPGGSWPGAAATATRSHVGALKSQACDYEPMSSPRLEWAAASCIAGWAVARLTGADRFRRLERAGVPLLSFTPQATAQPAIQLAAAHSRRGDDIGS